MPPPASSPATEARTRDPGPGSAGPLRAPGLAATTRVLVGACLLALTATPFARAQEETGRLDGRVVRADTGEPVAGAVVRAGDASAVTDGGGRFALEGLTAGSHRVRASYIGFTEPGRTVRIHADTSVELTLELRRDAIVLGDLVVGVEGGRAAWTRDLLQRIYRHHGHFLTREEIAAANPMELTDLFRRIPGVFVFSRPGTIGRRIQVGFGRRTCSPRVYVDGGPVPGSMLEQIPPGEVVALGVLTRPVASSVVGCGTISVVTRAGAARG